MSPEILQRLADFERRHRPDSRQQLARFRDEILVLHFRGYSLKSTFQYLKELGVSCSLRTFERWVKENVDFTKEALPEAAKRPLAALSSAEGAQGAAAAAGSGEAPKRPLLVDNKGSDDLDSAQRQERVAKARQVRESGFLSPVERALEHPQRGTS